MPSLSADIKYSKALSSRAREVFNLHLTELSSRSTNVIQRLSFWLPAEEHLVLKQRQHNGEEEIKAQKIERRKEGQGEARSEERRK